MTYCECKDKSPLRVAVKYAILFSSLTFELSNLVAAPGW